MSNDYNNNEQIISKFFSLFFQYLYHVRSPIILSLFVYLTFRFQYFIYYVSKVGNNILNISNQLGIYNLNNLNTNVSTICQLNMYPLIDYRLR